MKGSAKQIEWANKIKEDFRNNYKRLQEVSRIDLKVYSDNSGACEIITKIMEDDTRFYELLDKIEESEFWIRYRGNINLEICFEYLYKKAVIMGLIK